MKKTIGLIWSIVKRFLGRGYDKEELYQKMFNLTGGDIKRLKSNYETVISIRHECQHLLQLAKMKEYFLGKKVEEKYKIFALATYMKEALDDYKQKEDSGVAYFLDVLEIDARLSEVTYVKNILQRDSRLNKNTAKSMKNFIEENITTNNYYWDYEDEFAGRDIKLGDFAKMYFNCICNGATKWHRLIRLYGAWGDGNHCGAVVSRL